MLIVTTEEWTMRKTTKSPGEKIVKDIKRATRKHYSSEEKIGEMMGVLRICGYALLWWWFCVWLFVDVLGSSV